MSNNSPNCSFCGKNKSQVKILIAGLDAHICENCIAQAQNIVEEELYQIDSTADFDMQSVMKPRAIANYLNQFVIGQDSAKKSMAVAVYNHYKRLNQIQEDDGVEIEKSNIVMVGHTGTGKTLLAKSIAKFLKVPFTIVDATVFTEAGYVGEDVESILSRLLQVCNYDVQAAERGIIYIDEIDKVARKSDNPSLTRDVSGEGVQQAMLKLLEGAEVMVPPQGGRKHPEQKLVKINTANILFICGGAFDGIERNIANRLNASKIGFKATDTNQQKDENYLQYINPADLKSFGLIPELIGRLPVLTHLDPLDKEALTQILIQPKNALIKQYKKLFSFEDIELEFEDAAIEFIVDKALEYNLGARGLRSICEAIMTDAMFDLPSEENVKTFNVSVDYCKARIGKLQLGHLKAA